MSANNSFLSTALFNFKRIELVEPIILKRITDAIKVEVIIIDQADPTRPSLGNPNNPRIKPADNIICMPAQITVSAAGNFMSPIPLKAAVKLPDSQTTIPPAR